MSIIILDEILKGTKDANLPTEECLPPDYSVLDGDAAYPKLEALIPEYNEPKVFRNVTVVLSNLIMCI